MNILNIFNINFWISLLYEVPAILIGLCFHEFAHAYAAHKMGDDTAYMMGRMTLNPAAHFDIVGLICMIVIGFGWAKPVPVNPRNYKGNPKVADIIVSLAGVTMNLLIAIVFAFIYFFLIYVCKVSVDNSLVSIVMIMIQSVVWLNLTLMAFNLIPVPPLDGSHVLIDLLPPKAALKYTEFTRRYQWPLLLGVLLIINSTGLLFVVQNALLKVVNGLMFFIFKAYI